MFGLKPRTFLTPEETKKLSQSIDVFEASTGCELVFNFRKKLGSYPLEAARALFYKFKLDKTEHRAAILVVISTKDRGYAVWADEKVHRQGGDVLWKQVGARLQEGLKAGNRLKALTEAMSVAQRVLEQEQPKDSKLAKKTLSNEPIDEDGNG